MKWARSQNCISWIFFQAHQFIWLCRPLVIHHKLKKVYSKLGIMGPESTSKLHRPLCHPRYRLLFSLSSQPMQVEEVWFTDYSVLLLLKAKIKPALQSFSVVTLKDSSRGNSPQGKCFGQCIWSPISCIEEWPEVRIYVDLWTVCLFDQGPGKENWKTGDKMHVAHLQK